MACFARSGSEALKHKKKAVEERQRGQGKCCGAMQR